MNIKLIITYFCLAILLLVSCTKEEASSSNTENVWEEKELDGASATIKGFEPGNIITRSTWIFDGQNLIFGWERGDKVGVYPTAQQLENGQDWNSLDVNLLNPETSKHPEYPNKNIFITDYTKTQSISFAALNPDGSQTAQLFSQGTVFEWDNMSRWTAYCPYNPEFSPLKDADKKYYNSLPFSFEGQVQEALPNMTAYYYGPNQTYKASETKACKHLGISDVLISSEMQWNGSRINFQLRHLGAVARFFLLAPDENLTLKSLDLICDKAIFYKSGLFDLTSHPYRSGKYNFGANLVGDEGQSDLGGIQITPTGDPSKNLTLNFPDVSSGNAVKIKKTSTTDPLSNYFVAYLMMYPINYNPATDGNMFVYVTAINEGGEEVHFVSEALEGVNMASGYYYQWVKRTNMQDGLYPIELTATLLPWQDIVGSGIETDLEK